MLGMFLGAVNQTIIAPAMPCILAELGGMSALQLDSRFGTARVDGHRTNRREAVRSVRAEALLRWWYSHLHGLVARRLDPTAQFERALEDAPPGLRGRLRAIVETRNPVALLSVADLAALERIGMAASAALLLDLTDGTS